MLKSLKQKTITALKWSEKYTKTDMVYLAGQSSWLLAGQGILMISALGLSWIFANYIEPSDYGIYRYILTIATIASITALTGFGVAISRAVTQGHSIDLKRILKTKIKYGLIGTFILLAIALYYLWKDNTLMATLLTITSIWIPFFDSLSDYQYILQGKKHFKLQTVLRALQRLTLTAVVIITIILTKDIILITFIYFATTTFSQYLAYYYTQKKYFNNDDVDTPYKTITKYAKQVSIQNIFFIGAGQLDKILLFKLLGPAKLAVYFFAIAIPNEIQGVLGNINSVAFPKLVDKNTHDFKVALLKKIAISTLILLIPVLLYWLVAPYIFIWLFPVYLESIFISQLFVGTILFIPASLLWHYFYATENKRALWYGTILGPSSLIISILIFVPSFDLIGAVLAVYVRQLIDLFFGLYFFLKKNNSKSLLQNT